MVGENRTSSSHGRSRVLTIRFMVFPEKLLDLCNFTSVACILGLHEIVVFWKVGGAYPGRVTICLISVFTSSRESYVEIDIGTIVNTGNGSNSDILTSVPQTIVTTRHQLGALVLDDGGRRFQMRIVLGASTQIRASMACSINFSTLWTVWTVNHKHSKPSLISNVVQTFNRNLKCVLSQGQLAGIRVCDKQQIRFSFYKHCLCSNWHATFQSRESMSNVHFPSLHRAVKKGGHMSFYCSLTQASGSFSVKDLDAFASLSAV